MKLKPSELTEHGYHLYMRYSFNELIGLVADEIRRKTVHMRSFWLLLGISGAWALLATVWAVRVAGWHAPASILVGAAGMIAIIPMHELLHALAFRIRGARHIRFGAKPRQLIFYAIARNFVADYREMRFILYLPAVVISVGLVVSMLFPSAFFATSIAWVVFIHMSACTGDFALASFMSRHRSLGIVTTDDEAEELVTCFYLKRPVGVTSEGAAAVASSADPSHAADHSGRTAEGT
ncbi:MAG: DUF3267 domain-containing protein [Spirochaetia bacterium]